MYIGVMRCIFNDYRRGNDSNVTRQVTSVTTIHNHNTTTTQRKRNTVTPHLEAIAIILTERPARRLWGTDKAQLKD